ncbi:MAG: vitamin B12 dependent-methionine synthase activation domain-containing protein [Prevotellaceae bacterium]|nr:vitamin B12 dependent-methionine synthase activation domain-containing protein [Prevotellaceae bacterium]
MLERAITYNDLCISPSELYEQMGYGDAVPDASVLSEIDGMTADVKPFLRPRFCFFIAPGTLDLERNTLTSCGKEFTIGRIIARQLRGSDAFAFFVATAGVMFEAFQQRLMTEGDMVKVFVADSMGSVIAEKTADCMEEELQAYIADNGWKHTNRFSPGYCGWHVSQQQKLFSLFPTPAPCGVKLTDSSLMIPIKSVSGVIGLGKNVRKLEYTCGLCDFKQCYKRKRK